jgi:hypothetical protein
MNRFVTTQGKFGVARYEKRGQLTQTARESRVANAHSGI